MIYYDPSGHENIPCDGIDEESKQIQESRVSEIENSLLSQIDNETEVILPSKLHKNKTEGHWETILDEVDQMKESGEYSKIYVNKELSNEVSVPKKEHNNRPDIKGVRKDNKLVDQVEVLSKTDSANKIMDRLKYNQSVLGERAGSIKTVQPRVTGGK